MVTEELRKRVMSLSDENEWLEQKCYNARVWLIVAASLLVVSVLVNLMLYDANERFDAAMKEQNNVVLSQNALLHQKTYECRMKEVHNAAVLEEAIEKGFIKR